MNQLLVHVQKLGSVDPLVKELLQRERLRQQQLFEKEIELAKLHANPSGQQAFKYQGFCIDCESFVEFVKTKVLQDNDLPAE